MTRSTLRLTSVLVAALCGSAVSRADDTHGLIISIDGLKGDWAAHPEKNNLKLPNISRLAARGAKVDGVLGVFPSVTYPSHTTLITGCYPAKHGILANEVFNPPTVARTGNWYWEYAAIQVPTLLDAAKANGWTTAEVSWPVCVGGPVDFSFPEIWKSGHFDEAFVEISKHCKPPELMAGVLTRYALGTAVGRDVSLTNAARYIVDQYKPRLMLVHLVELDEAQHKHGPDTPEARAAAELCDERVGEILARYEAAGLLKNTVVAIVSDHGFLPTRKQFHTNAVLAKAGLIRAGNDERGPAEDYDAVGWNAGGSCSILLKQPDNATVLARVQAALAPYTGKPNSPIRRVIGKEEIAKLGGNPRAALMLDAGDDWTFGSGRSGPVETDSTQGDHPVRGMHGQMPDRPGLAATFVAAGPGIATGATLPTMRMIDVAPTIATALQLTMKATDGQAVPAISAARK